MPPCLRPANNRLQRTAHCAAAEPGRFWLGTLQVGQLRGPLLPLARVSILQEPKQTPSLHAISLLNPSAREAVCR